MKQRKAAVFAVLCAALVLIIGFWPKKERVSGISFDLPGELRREETGNASQIFCRGDTPVGGVIQFPVPDIQWQAKPTEHLAEICEALKGHHAPLPEEKYDYFTSASPGDSLHMWLRDPETGREWEHFVLFYPDALLNESTAYDLWFDKSEIDESEIAEILESVQFDPQ